MNVPTCPTQEILLAYVEGELLPAQARQVEAYLLHDPALKSQLEGMKRDLAGLRALPQVKAPASLMKGVLEHLDGTPGQRMNEEAIAFSSASDGHSGKSGKAKVIWVYQRVALSGLAAAATIAVTLGLVYLNAPPALERPSEMPRVPMAKAKVSKPLVKPAVKGDSVDEELTSQILPSTGDEDAEALALGNMRVGSQAIADDEMALASAVDNGTTDEWRMMASAEKTLSGDDQGADPLFVVDMPRSFETGMLANLDAIASEPGAEYRKSEEVAKQMQAIAMSDREPVAIRTGESPVQELFKGTGGPVTSMIDKPEVGPSLTEMTPASSDVSDMQVRTVNLGFTSVDKGQKSILDWAANNQIRVLSSAPTWDPSIKDRVASQLKSGSAPGNVAAGTRELRLVVTQEQMQNLMEGLALANGVGPSGSGTNRTLASRTSGTSVATMEIPAGENKGTEAAADGKKLFVLQVFLGENGK